MFGHISTPELIILIIFTICVLVQLLYTWGIFSKLAFYKAQPSYNDDLQPVSIIIAARNESDNLEKNLASILEQDYPEFEVVVVNDCSWDASQKILESMQQQYEHLKVSQLIEQEKYPTGKKFALTIGIKAAKYDLLFFTDADCVPASNQWLRLMQSHFTNNVEIVLGYSPYKKYKGFLNLCIRFETFMTALFYFSFALMKNAFMGVGRNLAYHKDAFFRYKGFAGHQHILSGDDDLFVNQAATPYNVAIELSPESFVYSEPKKDFTAYSRQKARHNTTGKYYKAKHQLMLGTYYASLILFYGTLAVLLLLNIHLWSYIVILYSLRFISQEIVYYMAAKKLQCTSVLPFLPVLDLLYVVYLLVYGTKGLFAKQQKW